MNSTKQKMNAIADSAFTSVFTRIHAFTILFEDSEVDQEILNIGSESTVFSVAAAGCGVASMVSRRPRRIDAVDINKHHLAITALKVAASQKVSSYDEFYQLLGYGTYQNASNLIRKINKEQPVWIQNYWNNNGKIFNKGFYQHGIFSKVSSILRRMGNIDEKWLREMIKKGEAERRQITDQFCEQLTRNPAVGAFLDSPVVLLGCGINFKQRKQNLDHWNTHTIQDVFVNLGRKMSATNCEDNWILWHGLVGHFDHSNPKCAPPYLRKESHKQSLKSPTQVNYNLESVFTTLGRSGPDNWSHYNLSDIADWMPETAQRQLFMEVHRTSKDESHLLFRSVEDIDLIDKLGLSKYFELVKPASKKASQNDRSKLYQRVNLYKKI